MIDIDPNERPDICEILRSFNNSMVYDDIKDKAEHLNPNFEGIGIFSLIVLTIKHKYIILICK
jgi:hypothetical protein